MNNLIIYLIVFCFFNSELFAREYLRSSSNVDNIELNNGSVSLTFQETATLKFLSIAGKSKSWTLTSNNDLIWRLFMKGPDGHLLVVNSLNAKYTGVKAVSDKLSKALVFSWDYPLSNKLTGKVFMTVSISDKSSLSEWAIHSEFPDGWSVTDLNFPIITLPKASGAKLIMPAGWGAEYDLTTIKNARYSNIYPSSRATVQLMSVYENNNVFYFATHDSKASLKTFSARVSDSEVELSNEIVTSESWNNNGKFKLPWAASIGVSNKGWEDAVISWYRPFTFETAWGKKTFKDKRYPEWLINSDLWLTGGHTDEKELKTAEKVLAFFGKETSFHWYYWFTAAFDTKYPEYLPAKEGFDSILKLIQGKGSHIMPYINGRLWDTTTVSYQKKGGVLATVLKKDLTPVIEIYPSKAPHAVICPASPVWSEIMVDLTEKIQGSVLGADAVFYDQVASARTFPCWNKNHNHPLGGGSFWNESYRNVFTKVRAVLKPGNIISTEQNAEPYLDMFDLFKMTNRPYGKEYNVIPLYSLIYSDRALLYGFYIVNNNDMSYRIQNALTLLWGAQLNGGRTVFVLSEAMKDNANFLFELTSFRKKQHDLFNGGRLLKEITPAGDNPLLNIPNWASETPAVRGALWKSQEGKYAVLLINIDNVKHEVTQPFSNKKITLKAGECFRLDLNESDLKRVI